MRTPLRRESDDKNPLQGWLPQARQNIVALGGTVSRRRTLQRALIPIAADLRFVSNAEDAAGQCDDKTCAIVVLPPLPPESTKRTLERLRDHPRTKGLPCFAAAELETSKPRLRRLYAAGVAAVLRWPADVSLVPVLLLERCGARLESSAPNDEELTLSRALDARIKPILGPKALASVGVRAGLAVVSGHVRSLPQRDRVLQAIAAANGVRALGHSGLEVTPPRVSAGALRQAAQRVIEDLGIDAADWTIATRRGRISVRGRAAQAAQIAQVKQALTTVRGATEVDVTRLTADFPPRGPAASSTRRVLARLFPTVSGLDLRLLAQRAVVRGQVRRLSIKRAVRAAVADRLGPHDIINLLQVRR